MIKSGALFPVLIQLHIAEIQNHINRDFKYVQHIENPGQIEEKPQWSGGLLVQKYFPGNSENVAQPDEKFKKQAFSLGSA